MEGTPGKIFREPGALHTGEALLKTITKNWVSPAALSCLKWKIMKLLFLISRNAGLSVLVWEAREKKWLEPILLILPILSTGTQANDKIESVWGHTPAVLRDFLYLEES